MHFPFVRFLISTSKRSSRAHGAVHNPLRADTYITVPLHLRHLLSANALNECVSAPAPARLAHLPCLRAPSTTATPLEQWPKNVELTFTQINRDG